MEKIKISLKDLTKVLKKLRIKNDISDRVRITQAREMLYTILNSNKKFSEDDVILTFNRRDNFQLEWIIVEYKDYISDMNNYFDNATFDAILNIYNSEMKV